jgi:tetratricopeptide (TPR) repeat protein
MKCKLISLLVLVSVSFFACTATNITYNPKEFDTINYQKNVNNAVDGADLFTDFDESTIPNANIHPQDFSHLIQADLLYNQGKYAEASNLYNSIAIKYKDPRIIYKAIICLEHISVTKIQIAMLNKLINLFIKASPDSQLAKLFQIKIALNLNNLELAKNNLDSIIEYNPQNGRVALLFISSNISQGLNTAHFETISDFANYIVEKYSVYPESNLLATISYTLALSPAKLTKQLNYTYSKFPNWAIPAVWSMGILIKNKNYDMIIQVLSQYFKHNLVPEPMLQNVYIGALIATEQLAIAEEYLKTQLDGQYQDNTFLNFGIVMATAGNYEEALTYLTSADITEPTVLKNSLNMYIGILYDYLANADKDKNKYLLAIDYYKKVINAHDANIANSAKILLLQDYAQLGKYKEMNNLLNKMAVDSNKYDADAILFKADIYTELGANVQAYELLAANLSKYKNDKNYMRQYMLAASLARKTNIAIKLYKEYIKKNSHDPTGYNNLAYIYVDQTTNYKLAKVYASKAYAMSPKDYVVLDTLGWIYYKLGDYRAALKYITASVDTEHHVDNAKHLKAVYMALGKYHLAHQVKTTENYKEHDRNNLLNTILDLISNFQYYGMTKKTANEK